MNFLLLVLAIDVTIIVLMWSREYARLSHVDVVTEPVVIQSSEAVTSNSREDSDARVIDTLEMMLGSLCDHAGEFGILSSVALDVAPGTEFPTEEVDHLVFTPWGIFLIETRDWSDHIGPATPDTLVQSFPDGSWEMHTHPLVGHVDKEDFLKRMLPEYQHAITSVGVFSNRKTATDPSLPTDLIRLDDLPYWIRLQRERHLERCDPMNTLEAWRTVQEYLGGRNQEAA